MADLEIKKGETYPGIKGYAFDADGPLKLSEADKVEIRIKGGSKYIHGTATVINPIEEDGSGGKWNYKYLWEAGDTDTLGTDYQHELWVYWDESDTPPRIQKVPNKLTGNPTIAIVQDIVE